MIITDTDGNKIDTAKITNPTIRAILETPMKVPSRVRRIAGSRYCGKCYLLVDERYDHGNFPCEDKLHGERSIRILAQQLEAALTDNERLKNNEAATGNSPLGNIVIDNRIQDLAMQVQSLNRDKHLLNLKIERLEEQLRDSPDAGDVWDAQSRAAMDAAIKSAAEAGINVYVAAGDNGSHEEL